MITAGTYLLSPDALVILLEPGDCPDGTGIRDPLHVVVTPPFPDGIHTLLYQDLVCGSGWPRRPSVLRVEGYVRLAAGCPPLGPLRAAGGAYDPGGLTGPFEEEEENCQPSTGPTICEGRCSSAWTCVAPGSSKPTSPAS